MCKCYNQETKEVNMTRKYTKKQFDKAINRTCKTFKCIEKAHIRFYCGGLKGANRRNCVKSAVRRANEREW